jgi:hypothetical protein
MSPTLADRPVLLHVAGALIGASLPAPIATLAIYLDSPVHYVFALAGVPTGGLFGATLARRVVATQRPWLMAITAAVVAPVVGTAILYPIVILSTVGVVGAASLDNIALLVVLAVVVAITLTPAVMPISLPVAFGAVILTRGLAGRPIREALLVVATIVGAALVAGFGGWLEVQRGALSLP